MDDEYIGLLNWAYQSGIQGEALFGCLAERESDPDRRDKLDVLRCLEAHAQGLLRPLLEAAGAEPEEDPSARKRGERMAAGASGLRWLDFVALFEPENLRILDRYHRLRDVAPPDVRREIEALIAHEEALISFAKAEMDGGHGSLMAAYECLGP